MKNYICTHPQMLRKHLFQSFNHKAVIAGEVQADLNTQEPKIESCAEDFTAVAASSKASWFPLSQEMQ